MELTSFYFRDNMTDSCARVKGLTSILLKGLTRQAGWRRTKLGSPNATLVQKYDLMTDLIPHRGGVYNVELLV